MRTAACLVASLLLATAALFAGNESPLPPSAALEEVQLTIVSRVVGLLNEGTCADGNHLETFTIRGTGEGWHTFDVGGDCPEEVRAFELSREEVETLVSNLLGVYFYLLEPDYGALPMACIDCSTDAPPGTLTPLITVTDHTDDITVTLRIGDREHTVRYHNGALVPGLTEWVRTWQPVFWRRAGFLQRFDPEDR